MNSNDNGAAAPVVQTRGLVRSFGKRVAVNGIDLSVPQGSVFGFLGPNGSGKTTTIRLLLGLIFPDAGQIDLFGQPMPKAGKTVLPRVGALVEGPAFYPYLTGARNLARLQAMDATCDPSTAAEHRAEALERVGLTAAAEKKFRHYSLGMKQRLGIAAALMQQRDLLILDEPTNGLDPQGTREIRELIRQLHADGTTVIVSSHLLSEIEHVCTHVGIMSAGRLVAQQSLAELRDATAPRLRIEVTRASATVAEAVLAQLGIGSSSVDEDESAQSVPDTVVFFAEAAAEDVPAVAKSLIEAGVSLTGLGLQRRRLEDAFVELTGAGFDVAG